MAHKDETNNTDATTRSIADAIVVVGGRRVSE
jgi:hypothetical protein